MDALDDLRSSALRAGFLKDRVPGIADRHDAVVTANPACVGDILTLELSTQLVRSLAKTITTIIIWMTSRSTRKGLSSLPSFESAIKQHFEALGKDVKQQQVAFQSQVTAQMQAWREAADKIHTAAGEFAAGQRKEIDATVSRMRADAAAAQAKLDKLGQAGTESWSALNAALTETRAAFDRANQAARDAFKRATGT
jgi:hypothetical protein